MAHRLAGTDDFPPRPLAFGISDPCSERLWHIHYSYASDCIVVMTHDRWLPHDKCEKYVYPPGPIGRAFGLTWKMLVKKAIDGMASDMIEYAREWSRKNQTGTDVVESIRKDLSHAVGVRGITID